MMVPMKLQSISLQINTKENDHLLKMYTLGIYDGHNSSCTLTKGSDILFSIEEERLSRIKDYDGRIDKYGPPIKSLKLILKILTKFLKYQKLLWLFKILNLCENPMIHWAKAIQDTRDTTFRFLYEYQ